MLMWRCSYPVRKYSLGICSVLSIVQEKMISDFRGAIETNGINLMVTLALNAGLSLNPDFPMQSLLSSVMVGRAFT